MVEIDLVSLAINYVRYTVSTAVAHVAPVIKNALASNPDLSSILLVLVILYVSLLIVNHTARMFYSFVMNIVRIAVVVIVVVGLVWTTTRGVPGLYEDFQHFAGSWDTTSIKDGVNSWARKGLNHLSDF